MLTETTAGGNFGSSFTTSCFLLYYITTDMRRSNIYFPTCDQLIVNLTQSPITESHPRKCLCHKLSNHLTYLHFISPILFLLYFLKPSKVLRINHHKYCTKRTPYICLHYVAHCFLFFLMVRYFDLSIYFYSLSYCTLLLETVSCDLSGLIGLLFLFYHLKFRSFPFLCNFCLFSKSLK